jgi:hypothetical protein
MANPDAHDRAQLAIAAYQAGLEGLVTEMLTLSPQFAKMRAAHEAEVRGPILKRIHHSSQAGPPELECQARRPAPACPDSTRASAAEQSFGSAAGQPPDDRKPAPIGGSASVLPASSGHSALPQNGVGEVADWIFPAFRRVIRNLVREAWRVLPPGPGLALHSADRASVS